MPSPACRSSMLLTIVALLAATLTGARSLANPPSEIAKKVMPSVVLVTTEDDQGEALARGSGFVVAEGVIATNLHVIRGASKAFVKVVNGQTQLEVLGIVAENNEWDLVLLAVKDLKAPPLPLGDSTALQVGDDVYAVGNPHGLEGTFSAGIVSSIRRLEGDALLQITAPISPGSSGGPIVNKDAEVVGVAVASLMEGQNLNFAISASYLDPMLKKRSDARALPGPDAEREVAVKPKDAESASDIAWSQFVDWMIAGAQEGEAKAMTALGLMYANGLGVAQDHREAVKWYRNAADLGDASAMNYLGAKYTKGEGVLEDDLAAVKWFRKAADLGDTQAMVNLGAMYLMGEGVAQDGIEAAKWFRSAGELGAADAMFFLGVMYANGIGVDKDHVEAVNWFRKAADLGDAEAMDSLGMMYDTGEGVAEDDGEAVKWYRKAADMGHAEAMFRLGRMYNMGRGVAKDYSEAVKWYRNAADLGNASAMAQLGNLYDFGTGVVQDEL